MLHEIKVAHNTSTGVNIEGDVIKKITRERFFAEIQDYQIDLKYLLESHKSDLNYLAKFNTFLRILKQSQHVSLAESVLFLEEEGMETKIILSKILSEENMCALERELGEKYRLQKANPNILDQYFE